jgi:hypothetical protein
MMKTARNTDGSLGDHVAASPDVSSEQAVVRHTAIATPAAAGFEQAVVQHTAVQEEARLGLELARKAFGWGFLVVTILIAILIGSAIILMFTVAVNTHFAPLDKSLIARLLQITFGMIFGAACLFLGITVAWFGVSASFSVNADTDAPGWRGKLALTSASPGIILILGGILLVTLAMYRPINYFENSVNTPQPAGPPTEHSPPRR